MRDQLQEYRESDAPPSQIAVFLEDVGEGGPWPGGDVGPEWYHEPFRAVIWIGPLDEACRAIEAVLDHPAVGEVLCEGAEILVCGRDASDAPLQRDESADIERRLAPPPPAPSMSGADRAVYYATRLADSVTPRGATQASTARPESLGESAQTAPTAPLRSGPGIGVGGRDPSKVPPKGEESAAIERRLADPPAAPPVSDADRSVDHPTERAGSVTAAEERVSTDTAAAPAGEGTPPDPTSPSRDEREEIGDWRFEGGQTYYKENPVDLSSIPREIVRTLVRASKRVGTKWLNKEVWGKNVPAEPSSISAMFTRTRKQLRDGLGLREEENPLPTKSGFIWIDNQLLDRRVSRRD